jgi:small multidrug resistance pump
VIHTWLRSFRRPVSEMAWLFLGLAIVAELGGTLGLRRVAESPVWWGIPLITGAYSVSFAFMWVALHTINVGVVYAIWSAVGTAAVAVLGALLFGDRLGWQAIGGMVIIVLGVAVLVTSGSMHHS